jgi:predicted permease
VSVLNAAHLVLQRTVDRQADWRLRRALGASAGRILGDLLAEGMVLAGAAGVVGVALAHAGLGAVRALAAASLPGAEELALDPRVLVAVAGVVLGVSVVLGLAPALRLARGGATMGADLRSAGAVGGRGGVRRALLVGQVAAATVLLVGAGLVVRSLGELDTVDLGIQTSGVVLADLHGLGMFDRSPDEGVATYRAMFDRLRALEGVEAVGAADIVPLVDNFSCDGTTPLDRPPPPPGEGQCAQVRSITPGLLEALGVPLLAGRALEWSDDAEAAGAMLVSKLTAERFWPGVDALGKSALVHGDTFTVVGIVGDVRATGPAAASTGHLYLPSPQEPWNGPARGLGVVVRARPGAPPSAAAIRDAIRSVDPREPVISVRPLESLRADRIAAFRLRGALMQAFAGLALTLAAVGLAGAVGLSVRRRRREFGVRLALGARAPQLTRQALAEAGRWVGVGVALGMAVALPAMAAARSLLFGVEPWDPAVLVVTPLALAGVVLLAAWLPARRAGATDPMISLRPE